MLTVERLEAFDFCCFEHVCVDLSRAGLVHVTGKNGDGKSTLFRALCWCLYGKTVDGDDTDKVIRHGAKRARVEVVVAEEGGARWMLRRVRSKGSPVFSLHSLDPEGGPGDEDEGTLVEGSKEDVAARVRSILGMDFEGFRNSALYSQGDAARFSNPSVTDAARKAVLHRMLNTDVLATCLEWARGQATACRSEEAAVLSKLTAERARGEALDPEGAREEMDQWERDRAAHVDRLVDLARAAKAEADAEVAPVDVEAARAALSKREAGVAKAEFDADEMARVVAQLQEDANRAASDAERVAEALRVCHAVVDKLNGSECPTCSAPLTRGDGLDRTRRARDDLRKAVDQNAVKGHAAKEARDALGRARTAWGAAKEACAEARAGHRAARDDLDAALAAGARREPLLEKARGLLAQAKAKRAEENPHEDRAALLAEKKRQSDVKAEAFGAELDALRRRAAHLAFWVKGFGNQGLPSYVLDSTMGFLTERANHYLGWLSEPGRRIAVEFRTQRELASKKGEVRDEIAVVPSVNGREGYALSHGQQKRLDLASGFALMDLAAGGGGEIGLLQLDEVLDGLDEGGRACAVSLLKELRTRRPSVLVISHEQDVGEAFESRWEVVMDADGVSTVEES